MDHSPLSPDGAAPFDWSASALGAPALWPPSLRLCMDLMFNTPLAMVLMWGPQQIMVFNDAYAALLGSKQLRAPGAKVPAMRPAVWNWNDAALEAAWAGQASAHHGQTLQVWRDGATQRPVLDLFYTPVRDQDGAVRGILCAATPSAPPAAAPSARSMSILVVEDNADARYLVCEMLRAFGHTVEDVADAERAVAVLAHGRTELLFTDVSLPGMSGVELARRAVRAQPGLGVIFASGFGDALTRHVDFPAISLQKPYDVEHLQNALSRISEDLQTRGI